MRRDVQRETYWPPRIIAFGGAAGSGKTTLARGLAAVLAGADVPVEYLSEDYLFRDSRLSDLAEMFRRKDFPGPDVLIEAWRSIVDRAAGSRWVITDGTWVHLAEDLPWAQASRETLVEYTRRLETIAAPMDPVTLFLRAPTETTLRRARARSGDDWVNRQETYLRSLPALETCPDSRLEDVARAWGDRVRSVLSDAGATVIDIDATGDASRVLSNATSALWDS